MFAHSSTRSYTAALLVVLALASCSDTTPSAPETSIAPQAGYTTGDVRLIEERSPFDLPGTSLSAIIGMTGGVLKLGGHTVIVPPGAVKVPTLFTISLPLDRYVNVDLLATVQTLLGILNVGERGFGAPVFVGLTYSRATNVSDPSDLYIAYVPKSGTYERMPSVVDQTNKVVWTKLDHFSKYCMASD